MERLAGLLAPRMGGPGLLESRHDAQNVPGAVREIAPAAYLGHVLRRHAGEGRRHTDGGPVLLQDQHPLGTETLVGLQGRSDIHPHPIGDLLGRRPAGGLCEMVVDGELDVEIQVHGASDPESIPLFELGLQLPSILRMCLAMRSLISRWRGTACEIPVLGFRYQSCLAPWRISTPPSFSIALIRSARFTPL